MERMPANVSTMCGSLLTVLVAVNGGDIIRTCVLGAVGTIVSYVISRAIKGIFERRG